MGGKSGVTGERENVGAVGEQETDEAGQKIVPRQHEKEVPSSSKNETDRDRRTVGARRRSKVPEHKSE